ncbi:uncharacterized protein LOC126623357 isoform X2 [Malus sylvestris]|nr:uncharacterized protein LOC126623357 isoform X2 [Malus sylvestris]XP_050148184.1 uncharacterized protein LOC126623357 isoform X2 [Malus sylvestris]XP_050148185.1 uncharacterized protein LOC126623357 isoform X2 [Malus sylvestris]
MVFLFYMKFMKRGLWLKLDASLYRKKSLMIVMSNSQICFVLICLLQGLDVLNMHMCYNLHSCATLGSLSRLVQLLLIMIIMDENGKKARVCETGAFSSRLTTGEVNALKEEVTILKGQLAAEGEQMSIIVWASQMFRLQIPMPALDLAPPSTSQFLCPTDTK